MKLGILWPVEELLEFRALLFERNHLHTNLLHFFAKCRVRVRIFALVLAGLGKLAIIIEHSIIGPGIQPVSSHLPVLARLVLARP